MEGIEQPGGGHLFAYRDRLPRVAGDVFIAPGAKIIGEVTIGAGSSVWFNCVVRGDVNHIHIGEGTNIQDGTVVHVTDKKFSTTIGNNVLIGHRCMIHGCVLEDGAFIGMGASVMDGCVVEGGAMVAAGALVTPGKHIPSGQLWGGRPARYMRDLSAAEMANFPEACRHYAALAQNYLAEQE